MGGVSFNFVTGGNLSGNDLKGRPQSPNAAASLWPGPRRPGQIGEIRGFSCRRGKEYAEQEHLGPRRLVTSTIEIEGGTIGRLPVKTNVFVPKDCVREVPAA